MNKQEKNKVVEKIILELNNNGFVHFKSNNGEYPESFKIELEDGIYTLSEKPEGEDEYSRLINETEDIKEIREYIEIYT